MKAGETWGPKGGEDQRALLRIDGIDGGDVLAFPLHGGFRMRFTAEEFAEKFERCSRERLEAMDGRFEKSLVGLDDFEEGEDIPCWTNGQLWNGWEVPYFERQDVEAAVADGRLTAGGSVLIWFDEGAGTYVEVMHQDGEELPRDLDRKAIVEKALKEGGTDEFELPDGNVVTVSLAPARIIDTPGGPVTVYNVGDGWTWSRSEEPAPAPR